MSETESPHIHLSPTDWVVISRMKDGVQQILCDPKDNKYWGFPSVKAALQWMAAEGWTGEQIAEVVFLPVEEE